MIRRNVIHNIKGDYICGQFDVGKQTFHLASIRLEDARILISDDPTLEELRGIVSELQEVIDLMEAMKLPKIES